MQLSHHIEQPAHIGSVLPISIALHDYQHFEIDEKIYRRIDDSINMTRQSVVYCWGTTTKVMNQLRYF